jgi:ectoine hydroxylase-related dioxygenase (phytanoyl-CoA dioxygenase family)
MENNAAMQVTPQQARFFEAFGYLKLTHALRDDMDWITSEFEQVFVDRGIVHDGTKRATIIPFIDQREKLCTLLDHPAIVNAGTALLGDDFNYLNSDGNYYAGDTGWHVDCPMQKLHPVGKFIKLALYLEPLRAATGALRVIPRSHELGISWEGRHPRDSEKLYGIPLREIPGQVLETDPGDLLIFNHNILHASFGGASARRMFTMNLCAHANTPEEIAEFNKFFQSHSGDLTVVNRGPFFSEQMRRTAGPERMRHLQQVIDMEKALAVQPEKKPEAALVSA